MKITDFLSFHVWTLSSHCERHLHNHVGCPWCVGLCGWWGVGVCGVCGVCVVSCVVRVCWDGCACVCWEWCVCWECKCGMSVLCFVFCCAVLCRCVWVLVLALVCDACVCTVCVARLGTRKNPLCVDSKRLRVHVQDVFVCTGKTPACVSLSLPLFRSLSLPLSFSLSLLLSLSLPSFSKLCTKALLNQHGVQLWGFRMWSGAQ